MPRRKPVPKHFTTDDLEYLTPEERKRWLKAIRRTHLAKKRRKAKNHEQ